MVWIKQLKVVGVLMVLAGIVTACSISYKFNGSSIDYTKVKTISFENFPNRSAGFVWGEHVQYGIAGYLYAADPVEASQAWR